MKVREIDHICFAVRSLDQARRVYENVLGLEPSCEYEAPQESIKVIRYWLGSVAVELLEPMTPDCEVARFLETRGEGFFLISYRVDNVEQALNELRDAGHHTIDTSPRTLMGNRYAFIDRPRAMHGVLTEIIDGEFVPAAK
jgi:methylmalonyl-CoA/ethylmalonyl-CoA epimerase